MKVLLINEVCGITSTGKICGEIAQAYKQAGHEVKIAYGRHGDVPAKYQEFAVRIGNQADICRHALLTRFTDRHGFGSKAATARFVRWAQDYNPDLIWLHNLHGYYINIEILFLWIKGRKDTQIKWTLHDCWAFTGHCAYFSYIGCKRWKTGCFECPQAYKYPKSYFKYQAKKNYVKKKELFTGIVGMEVIVPSKWLASLVSQSFLKEYPVRIKYNTVDREAFRPRESAFKEDYGLSGKKAILGVSSVWEPRKGLGDFIKLSRMLDDSYAIVLVGLSKRQMEKLPKKIVGIGKVGNMERLAEIYSACDIYVNASREETFGMTTLEAIACGVPVIVYKGTACEEVFHEFGQKGMVVKPGARNLARGIQRVINM